MPEIDIIIPTLGRALNLPLLVANITETTPTAHRVVLILDSDDHPSWDATEGLDVLAVEHGGSYPVKTNAGVFGSSSPFVLLTGDDVIFHAGWLEPALAAFADKTIQVVGTRDLSPITADGSHVTMPILRRAYIRGQGAAWKEPGSCLHEGYHHNYSETETWQLAQHRGVARFIPESVIEHLHPDWGKRHLDSTDARGGQANKQHDHDLFNRRRSEWLAS